MLSQDEIMLRMNTVVVANAEKSPTEIFALVKKSMPGVTDEQLVSAFVKLFS